MSKELDNIIKEELMRDIQIEATEPTKNKKTKVYSKIAGLNNIGRTYFVSLSEIVEKNKYAQTQMAQKYGAEIYGIQAQGSNGGSNSLISCKVSTFLTVPQKFVSESQSGFEQFVNMLDDLTDYLETKSAEWKNSNSKEIKQYKDCVSRLDDTRGANDEYNVKLWTSIKKQLETFQQSDNSISKRYEQLKTGYRGWQKNGIGGSGNMGNEDPATTGSKGNDWNPNYSYRIDITTKFDDNWFKKEFKSGLLNKAIMAVKTSAMARATDSASMKGHKYTADEMLPQDKRKLDGIQWKMTNKVAKDFVSLLLGWSRDKKVEPDGTCKTELKEDKGFGKKMASNALDGRGILGRLKQQIFSGGQQNNTISIVFQLADKYDGTWEFLKKSDKDEQVSNKQEPDQQEQKSDDSMLESRTMLSEKRNQMIWDLITCNESCDNNAVDACLIDILVK